MVKEISFTEVFNYEEFIIYISKFVSGYEFESVLCDGFSVPYIKTQKNGFSYTFSSPFGLYCPVISLEQLEKVLIEFTKKGLSLGIINIGPESNFSKEDLSIIAKKNNYKLIERYCHIFKCDTNLEGLLGKFNETRRKHIKRYLKYGKLNVFRTKDSFYFKEYYKLYEDSARRWGSKTVYSKEMIADLWTINGVYMWVAELNGEMVSGMICFYHNDSIFDWLAASYIDKDAKNNYAAVAVQYEVIKQAQELGYLYVNMGASEGLHGVSNYKDSWGANLVPTFTLYKQSFLYSVLKGVRNLILKIK